MYYFILLHLGISFPITLYIIFDMKHLHENYLALPITCSVIMPNPKTVRQICHMCFIKALCFYLIFHIMDICGFFSLRNFYSTFVLPHLSPFDKKMQQIRRLTLQVLGTLQIHFWSLLCKGKVKTRNQFKNSVF